MTVYKRGKGFQSNFTHKGERYVRQFDTEMAAQAWELEAKAALLKGQPVPEVTLKVGGGDVGTLKNVFRRTVTYHWDRLRGSQSAVVMARVFVDYCGENIDPREAFTQSNIDNFVTYLIDERKVCNHSINRYMSAIRQLMKTCKRDLKELPEYPSFKTGQGRVRFFSEQEEAQILYTLDHWGVEALRDFFIFLLDTGARPYSEGLAFTWADVSEKAVTFWETKTGVSRSVPLTRRAYEAIQRQKLHNPTGEHPFGGNITKTKVRLLWQRLQGHLPALQNAVVYTTRHTCCTRLVQRGIDLRRVQVWMGHNNIQTTMKYAHFSPSHLFEAVAVLEQPKGFLLSTN